MRFQRDPLTELIEQGQSVWLDTIDRDLLVSGRLAELIGQGVTGLTSNPTIFERAIARTTRYDADIRALAASDDAVDAKEIYEHLAIGDIQSAADALLPAHERSGGRDGFACLEVSPHLATDPAGTLEEARRLHARAARPNVMIKVPGTPEGLGAIEQLIREGIPVNVTLLFSVGQYEAAARAFIRGAEASAAAPPSVASLFVSRIDTRVDAALRSKGDSATAALLGRAALAQARLVYARSLEIFAQSPVTTQGAPPQRPLWASTSTKDPAYRDVRYVEELIAPGTVTTLPLETLEAFRAHGVVRGPTATRDLDDARRVDAALADRGISCGAIAVDLQREGVDAFTSSFESVLAAIRAKAKEALARA